MNNKLRNGDAALSKAKTTSGLPKMHSRTSSISSLSSEKAASLSNKLKRSPSSVEVLNPNSDNLKVGDKVYVNGTKPGFIRFQGETSFAPGQWCGVELDDFSGKNDGSVNGVKYFECKQNNGIFVRPHRLTSEPIPQSCSTPLPPAASSVANGSKSTNNGTHSSSIVSKTTSSLLKVGDKVLVNTTSGMKRGTLLYLGSTDFATGVWAGIELTEPSGKNDGSVAGKRYFTCQANYGLFAPTNKVVKDMVNGNIARAPNTVKKSPSISTVSNLLAMRKNGISDSRESLLSVTSTTSHRSGRIRLGVNSLSSQLAGKRESSSPVPTVSSPTTALAKTLKEKEDQISHLLKEKDIESSEWAKVASRLKAVEEELALVKSEKQRIVQEKDVIIHELEESIDESKSIAKQLMTNIEEERKKVEMLEFRLEEELANKMELKEEVERLGSRVKSLHMREEESDELFQVQEELIKKDEKVIQLERTLEKNKNEIQNLTQRIKEYETKTSIAEQRQANYLQSIDQLNLELKKRQIEAEKMREDFNKVNDESKKLRENMDEILRKSGSETGQIQVLMDKLKKSDEEKLRLDAEMQIIKSKLDKYEEVRKDLELEISKAKISLQEKETKEIEFENKERQLKDEIERKIEKIRELEQHLEGVVQSSGSDSEQLTRMSEEIKAKQAKIDELHENLNTLQTQVMVHKHELEVAKDENDNLKRSNESKDEELGELKKSVKNLEENLKTRNDDCRSLEEQVNDSLKKISDGNAHLIQINENLKAKQNEIDTLQETISKMKKKTYDDELEYKKLQSELNEIRRKESEKANDLAAVEKKKQEMEEEMVDLVNQIKEQKDQILELDREKRKLSSDVELKQKNLNDKDDQISKLREQIQANRTEFDELRRNLEGKIDQSKLHGESLLQDLTLKVEALEREKENLTSENERLSFELKKVMEEMKASENRHKEVLNQFEDDCSELEKRLAEKEKIICERSEKIKNIESDHEESIQKWKSKMEQEKDNLLAKISQLEQVINTTKNESVILLNGSTSTNNVIEKVSDEDREAYESQIGFLNSVIVDMQKKNDDLKARIHVLEEIGLSEFDDSSLRPVNGSLARAPRLFCDICDMFDKHDTEDCPMQKSSPDDYANHSRHNGQRHVERAYCTNCEVFGHKTHECAYNESF